MMSFYLSDVKILDPLFTLYQTTVFHLPKLKLFSGKKIIVTVLEKFTCILWEKEKILVIF